MVDIPILLVKRAGFGSRSRPAPPPTSVARFQNKPCRTLCRCDIMFLRHTLCSAFPQFLGGTWERMARERLCRYPICGRSWSPANRWWGRGLDRAPVELDLVSESMDGKSDVLVGEVKVRLSARGASRCREELRRKARMCKAIVGRRVHAVVFVLEPTSASMPDVVVTGEEILGPDASGA